MKGQEGSELSKLNAIYQDKKLKVRQMEIQVSETDNECNNRNLFFPAEKPK